MTHQAIEELRNRVAAGQVGYTEVWSSINAALGSLMLAVRDDDVKGIELHARYIADVAAWLKGGK